MNSQGKSNSQSFDVDDIRSVRDDASRRYRGKSFEEIALCITEGAEEGYGILERLRRGKPRDKHVTRSDSGVTRG